jgi:PAS domain S-box-containing protein
LFLSYLSRQLFLESFRRIEVEQVQRNLSQAREALAERTARLGRGDWAAWDDLYNFVHSEDPEFAKINLIDVTYDDLQVNAIVIADEGGKVIYSGGYDLTIGRAMELPAGLVPYLAPGSLLLSHPDAESKISGLLLLPEGPLLVSSLPILTSERHGPVRGSLVMARFLDDVETARIGQMTHLNLSFQRLDSPLPGNYLRTAGKAGAEASGVFVVDSDTIGGYSVISDLTGEPAVMIRILQPRPIYRQGARTVRLFLLWFSAATCALVGACCVLLDRLVLSRARGRESEARFRNIFEHAAAGMATLSLDGRYLQTNPAFQAFVGYSAEELLAADIFQVTHPADREATAAMLKGIRDGGLRTHDYEKRFLRKDGEVVWGRVTVAWLQDSEGKPTYAVALIQDITKRKRAEEGLHLARFCIDHAAIGIFRIEADGRIGEVNDQACSSLGYSREELCTRTVFDIDPDLTREWWFAHRQGLMRTKESKTIETRHRRQDGLIYPVEVTINYLEYAGRLFAYSFVKDITSANATKINCGTWPPMTN